MWKCLIQWSFLGLNNYDGYRDIVGPKHCQAIYMLLRGNAVWLLVGSQDSSSENGRHYKDVQYAGGLTVTIYPYVIPPCLYKPIYKQSLLLWPQELLYVFDRRLTE